MLKAVYDPSGQPGTWSGGRIRSGQRTALYVCPECGGTGSLSQHNIADDGMVTPSVVCGYQDCKFHDFIQLEGWDAHAIETR